MRPVFTLASLLGIILISLAAFSAAAANTNKEDCKKNADLNLHRLINALHPFKNEIKSTWTRRAVTTEEDSQGPLTCHMCNTVMPMLQQFAQNCEKEQLRDMVINACKILSLAPRPEICTPIITAYTEQFLYILANSTATDNEVLPGTQICGILTANCDHPALTDWSVNVAGGKPETVDRVIVSPTGPTTKILQFTDLHVDLDYAVGTNTDCGEGMPICCRDYEGIPENASKRAGPYGDFHCALPLDTMKLLFTHAKDNNPETKFIFLTGDYIHSGVWLYNEEENGRHVRNVTRALAQIFPDKSIPIFPVVGNHEPHLVNMYPPVHLWDHPGFNLAWLYRDVLEPFIERDPDFLDKEEIHRFLTGGYYSVSPKPGNLKIIVLNTNLCSPENFWLAYNPYNVVREQLQWFADVLKKAEDDHENVLIVGHIEPGNCWPVWSGKFNEVVERFEGIIRGSFFGHSHKPQYRISMAKEDSMKPVFASYIAGSGLPDKMHPAYSVFHVDGARNEESKWDVVRHELMIMHLTESNKLKKPVFKKLADSYETFKMENLSPASILQFAERLMCNQELIDKYLEFHTKGSDNLERRECKAHDSTCMTNILCNIVSSNAEDKRACKQLEWKMLEKKCPTSDAPHATYGVTILFITLALVFTPFH